MSPADEHSHVPPLAPVPLVPLVGVRICAPVAASAVSIRPSGSSVASITTASSMDSIRFFIYAFPSLSFFTLCNTIL